jgi:hypothetical protein
MAFYTTEQLKGSGSLNEALAGSKTFNFTNSSSGSCYFNFEITHNSTGSYDANSTQISASISSQNNTTNPVMSFYIHSIVLGPGSSSFVYTPSGSIPSNVGYFRGTGQITLNIT